MSEAADLLGPVDYLVVEFDADRADGEALAELISLTERGIIRVLDLLFIVREADGSISGLDISDFDGDGELDLALFAGASSGLLGEEDVQEAGQVLQPGRAAALLVYENSWAAPFAAALRRKGADLVAMGRIPHDDLVAAIEALED